YGEKRYSDAAGYLERAVAINDRRLDCLVLLAATYVANKQDDKAREIAAKGLALDPSNRLLNTIMHPPAPTRKAAAAGAAPKAAAGAAPPKGKIPVIEAPGATATAPPKKK